MQAFKRLTVTSNIDTDGSPRIRVDWALDRGFAQPGPYSFELLRLEGPGDTQPEVVSFGGDGHWIYDINPRLPQHGRSVFYQVRLTDATGETWGSQVAAYTQAWSRRDWRIARAVTHDAWRAIRKRTGTRGWLAKRRKWGTPCPDCVDPITRQVDDPNCGSCYGTAFVEGYHTPVTYWAQVEQSAKQSALTSADGHVKQNQVALTALAYPPAEPGDIWIMQGTDQRFRVGDQVRPSAIHRGVPLILQFQVTELPTSDAVYAIPLPEDGLDVAH